MGLENTKFSEEPEKLNFFSAYRGKVKKIVCGSRNSFVLLDSGELYSFGDNSEGQSTGLATRYNTPIKIIFDFEETDKIVDIEAGWVHSFIQCQSGKFYSFGSAADDKLGNNETQQFSCFAKPVQKVVGRKISKFYLGKNCSLLLTS